jgi:hypothetical protein
MTKAEAMVWCAIVLGVVAIVIAGLVTGHTEVLVVLALVALLFFA